MSGYKSKHYAQAFAHIGEIQHLSKSKSWVIERNIEDSQYSDVIGCYPLFSCSNWDKLSEDLQGFSNRAIAFSLVTDPFGDFNEADLKSTFPDVCKPFKTHYILDLEQDIKSVVKSNHLRNAKKAFKKLDIERVAQPLECLDSWTTLYDHLVQRHNIQGIASFSVDAFKQQFETPGLIVYRALLDGKVSGMVLFYEMDSTVYYHLGAYSQDGYENRASFGIFLKAINDFKSRNMKWLNLGSGAGTSDANDDGLVRFKKGWASETRTAWFCGKILNHSAYQDLASKTGSLSASFFPAYRNRL